MRCNKYRIYIKSKCMSLKSYFIKWELIKYNFLCILGKDMKCRFLFVLLNQIFILKRLYQRIIYFMSKYSFFYNECVLLLFFFFILILLNKSEILTTMTEEDLIELQNLFVIEYWNVWLWTCLCLMFIFYSSDQIVICILVLWL